MTKDEINAKLAKLAGKEQCTNKFCATKNIDYTRSFDACVDLLDVLGYVVHDCDNFGSTWSWYLMSEDNQIVGEHKYPVYALALALAEIPEE